MERKKKILVLIDWFEPGFKAGGPIQSTVNFSFAMKNDFDVSVLTTDTDHGESAPYDGITSNKWTNNIDPRIKVYYARKKTLSLAQLKREIIEAEADFVYLNHLFSPKFVIYPLWLKITNRLKSTVVLCPRGALYKSAMAVKFYKKWPLMKLYRLVQLQKKIVFHATDNREKQAIQDYFPGAKVHVANNLPNSSQQPLDICKKEQGSVKCIFIARIVAIKNLLYLLECIEQSTANISLTIIGPIEEIEYWGRCEEKIRTLPPNIKVEYPGAKKNKELAYLIQQHHLFVLPTEGENFGHSIFESFLSGRPVLISDQTPWRSLESKNVGWDLPLQNKSAFKESIEMMAAASQQQFDAYARAAWQFAHDFLKNSDIYQQYLRLFS